MSIEINKQNRERVKLQAGMFRKRDLFPIQAITPVSGDEIKINEDHLNLE